VGQSCSWSDWLGGVPDGFAALSKFVRLYDASRVLYSSFKRDLIGALQGEGVRGKKSKILRVARERNEPGFEICAASFRTGSLLNLAHKDAIS
jgi:hypothetical protein